MGELREHLKLFLEIAPVQRGYSVRTLEQYRSTCQRLCAFLGEEARLKDFTTHNLLRWQAHLIEQPKQEGKPPLKGSSLNSYYAAVSAWGKWLQARGLLPQNPAECLEKARTTEPRRYEISDETAFALIAACDLIHNVRRSGLCRAVLSVLVHSGVRLSELIALSVEDFHPARRLLVVRAGKGGKRREIPLCQAAVQAVEAYLAIRPADCRTGESRRNSLFMLNRQTSAGEGAVHTIIAQCARLIRYTGHITPHSFRHCYATRLLRNSRGDVVAVSKLLGHSKVSTTLNVYSHTDETRMRAVADLSEQKSAPVPGLAVVEASAAPIAPGPAAGAGVPLHAEPCRETRSRRISLRHLPR